MIIDISDKEFRTIMSNPDPALPKARANPGFYEDLDQLFTLYVKLLRGSVAKGKGNSSAIDDIADICKRIRLIVDAFLQGDRYKAFSRFSKLMREYYSKANYQLKVYEKLLHAV